MEHLLCNIQNHTEFVKALHIKQNLSEEQRENAGVRTLQPTRREVTGY
jgi:hypothetical protein